MEFWLVAVAMVVIVAASLGLTLWRGHVREEKASEMGLQVYRDQMAEVERDLARGVLSPEAAERTRAEIGRRILAADRAREGESSVGTAPRGARLAALAVVAVAGAGSLWVYDRVGAPGYPDMSLAERIAASDRARADRPSQAQAEAMTPAQKPAQVDPKLPGLVEKLKAVLKDRPDDAKGLGFLATSEAALGDYAAARKAQEARVKVLGDKATVSDLVELLDDMAIAAGGRITPQADPVLARILKMDPQNGPARYYLGLLDAQVGRPDEAFAIWNKLLEDGPESAPWIAPIRSSIRQLAELAGIPRYEPPAPAGLPGPNAADVAAASNMSQADRMQMIRSMVDGLSKRLASEGGTVDEWARLIRSLGVLGETDRAQKVWTEAQNVFASNPADLAKVRAAAQSAGVTGDAQAAPQAPAAPAAPDASLPGPSSADIANAQNMSASDRTAMIRNMVQRLDDRLMSEGGTADEWARLIRSFGVLGQPDRAKAALAKAQEAFAGTPADLAKVNDAARAAGIAQ